VIVRAAEKMEHYGIRVNAVSPGPVSTDLWLGESGVAQTVARATGVDPETARKNVLASIGGVPTGRLSTPDEVATLAVLLASPVTANVTGSNYVIDGGLIKTT
jgi:NAD(P)-dependent dehydrogenase (short-subunit alcohol dehydrogenase family)